MSPAAISLSSYEHGQLDDGQLAKIESLLNRVWPDKKDRNDSSGRREAHRAGRQHVAWDGADPVAFAQTFPRTIRHEGGELPVMALASVCVDPAYRGKRLGARIVREAFLEVDEERYGLSLFQTGVPDFYRKLGGVLVRNRFVDRTAADPDANPWWEPHIMVYPADADWPDGDIDLNGAGY